MKRTAAQYGFSAATVNGRTGGDEPTLPQQLRDALPNASFKIGFTGTADRAEPSANTRAVFRRINISIYDIQRAVADRATVRSTTRADAISKLS